MSVLEKEVVQPKTFKQADTTSQKEYHYMLRAVGPAALPDGTITGDQLDVDVMYWLNRGYRIEAIHLVNTNKGAGGEFQSNVYGYHFVKE